MIAIPPPLIVERNDEQVGALEGLQHRLPGLPPGNRIAQGAAHAVKDRGLQQEAPDVPGLTLQDLFDQVVDDVAIIARERADEAADVITSLD